jgi:hypothetical protein
MVRVFSFPTTAQFEPFAISDTCEVHPGEAACNVMLASDPDDWTLIDGEVPVMLMLPVALRAATKVEPVTVA